MMGSYAQSVPQDPSAAAPEAVRQAVRELSADYPQATVRVLQPEPDLDSWLVEVKLDGKVLCWRWILP